jgi:hypothetical protein
MPRPEKAPWRGPEKDIRRVLRKKSCPGKT